MNIDTAKSYKTEANLVAALTKLGFINDHLVVCNRAGRFTAIFPANNGQGNDMIFYASQGFITLG